MNNRFKWLLAVLAVFLLLAPMTPGAAGAGSATGYVVLLKGTTTTSGFQLTGTKSDALAAVTTAGGTVAADLTSQIGTLIVTSSNPSFATQLSTSSLVEDVAGDFGAKSFPSYQEAIDSGQLSVIAPASIPGGGPDPVADPLEVLQWDMAQIRAPQAHAVQAGARAVDVGIVDSGIDGRHVDFVDTDGSNVDCARERNFVPLGPSPLFNPAPCSDNQFHGTHVAGTVAARANGVGIVGVAPNVTLVPIRVCDAAGYCYASSVIAGITYAGDIKLDAINMSLFVDDDTFLASTEFKCMSDPAQRVLRKGVERAIQYARNQGVTPVAALGNSGNDLAHPPEPYENDCDVVPAETQGVVGTVALGPSSEKAPYSNYGSGRADVSAPGGNSDNPNGEIPGPCGNEVLSTIPGDLYGCFEGTSMASPHATGVAALIISQFGRLGTDAGEPDVVMRPTSVESYLQSTTVDLIAAGQETATKGYDYCFGNGRIDALRAVLHTTSAETFTTEPCPPQQNLN